MFRRTRNIGPGQTDGIQVMCFIFEIWQIDYKGKQNTQRLKPEAIHVPSAKTPGSVGVLVCSLLISARGIVSDTGLPRQILAMVAIWYHGCHLLPRCLVDCG